MPTFDAGAPGNANPGPGIRPVSRESRAYCGPAHGRQWTGTDPQPPAWVVLPVGASSAVYRLMRHPRTGRPARDQLGNYLYVPIAGDHTRPDDDSSPVTAGPRGRTT